MKMIWLGFFSWLISPWILGWYACDKIGDALIELSRSCNDDLEPVYIEASRPIELVDGRQRRGVEI